MEAINLELDSDFDGSIEYRSHVEAIEVVLVPKGETSPSVTECSIQDAHIATVNYSSHIEEIGWQELRYNGAMSFTTGQRKRMEAIRINLEDQLFEGGIEYRAHVQNIGWQDWVGDNAESGTTGKSKRMEAVQIRLTGQMARIYDVYYRVHSEEFGWLDWTKNGESAGTEGFSLHIEAIEIMLVRRGEAAPGPTTTPFMHQ